MSTALCPIALPERSDDSDSFNLGQETTLQAQIFQQLKLTIIPGPT